jgi:hypothetical protein
LGTDSRLLKMQSRYAIIVMASSVEHRCGVLPLKLTPAVLGFHEMWNARFVHLA